MDFQEYHRRIAEQIADALTAETGVKHTVLHAAPLTAGACPWCGEPVLPGDAYPLDAYGVPGTLHHRECWVRLIVGSVGHQLGICGCAGGPKEMDDPPDYTRAEAASAAAKLAQDLAAVPDDRRGRARSDAREMVRRLGADVLFAWTPGAGAN